MGDIELPALIFGQGLAGERGLQVANHKGQRSPELVADIGEESGFCVVELFQQVGSLLFLFRQARILNDGAYLRGHKLEKSLVIGIDRTCGIDTRDKDAERLVVAARDHAQNNRLGHSLVRGPARKRIEPGDRDAFGGRSEEYFRQRPYDTVGISALQIDHAR